MAEIARDGSRDERVKALALLLGNVDQVNRFIRRAWTVVDDPWGVEYIVRPRRQIDEFLELGTFRGDCDDSAVLAGALALALGSRAWLVAIRLEGNPEFSHVWLQTPSAGIDPVVPESELPITKFAEAMIETL